MSTSVQGPLADARDDQAAPVSPRPAFVERSRLVVACAAMCAVALQQAPQLTVSDTKLDLALDPLRFLGRALHLWDPTRDFGQTQNQSYGYLFPMGPFFALGRAVGMPPWLVQRLWWALLLCLALVGLVRLAERLGLGDPTSRLLGGVAFALSPRVLTTLGPISVESLPYCLAPWVLLPLVEGAVRGSPRRAAARSGVAVLCMGAVNAAAVLLALPPAALWLLTRAPGPRRRRLVAWWVLAVLLATSWWVVPLLLLGRYSPPFLSVIETAATTTSVTGLVEVLRGASDWVAYVATPVGPVWPTGWALLTEPALVAYTVLVVAAGLAGLLRRDLPERTWLVACLLTGVAAVTAGHVGALDGPLAGPVRDLLDGALAPLRNVHKAEVVLRLPLVLGLVHLLGRQRESAVRGPHPELARRLVTLAAAAAVLGAALPVLTGLAPRDPFVGLPGYWSQAARWLDAHPVPGRTLLVPGASAPDYAWGSTNDEPLQVLLRTPWAVRSAVPLTPPGTVRLLDAVEQRLAAGQGGPGLVAALARAGVTRVLARSDLDLGQTQTTRPLLVAEALRTAGLVPTRSFGPDVGDAGGPEVLDQGLAAPFPALVVWDVPVRAAPVQATPLSDVVRLTGGPESLLPLEDRGLLRGRPTLLAAGAGVLPSASPGVLTDGLRRHEVFFGRTLDGTSATLTPDEPYRLDAPAADDLPPGGAADRTAARLLGARAVVASSSASDAAALGGARPEHAPYAAVDGDPETSWRADPFAAARASWSLTLDAPRSTAGLRLVFDPHVVPDRTVTVRADSGSAVVPVSFDPAGVPVRLPPGPTRTLGVEGGRSLALAEVVLPGLQVARTLDTPRAPGTPVLALDEVPGARGACASSAASDALHGASPSADPDVRCGRGVARGSEEPVRLDRTVHPAVGGAYAVQASAQGRTGPSLDRLLDTGLDIDVAASSRAVADPGGRPGTVVDGRAGTGWRAAPGDQDPTLTLSWFVPHRLTRLRLRVAPSLGASVPVSVVVVAGGRSATGPVGPDGEVRLSRAVAGTSAEVHLRAPRLRTGRDPYTLARSLLPLGVSELEVAGAPVHGRSTAPVALRCGQGPLLDVGGVRLRTRATVARADLELLRPFPLAVCAPRPVPVRDGTRVVLARSPLARGVSVTLRPASGDDLGRAARPLPDVAAGRWGATERAVALPARSAPVLLQVRENSNPGWAATLDGSALQPVLVDGWQQGWVVPAGAAGTVRLRYGPDRLYRAALGLGVLPVLVLLALALRRGPGAVAGAERTGRGWAAAGVLGLVLVVVGGLPAAGLALLAGLLPERWRAPVGVGALLAAGGLLVLHPFTSAGYAGRAAPAQALCLTALAVVWSTLVPRGPGPRRSAGASTNR